MNRCFQCLTIALLLAVFNAGTVAAQAQEQEQAQDKSAFFESLFKEVEAIIHADQIKNQQREQEFLQRKDQQASLLSQQQARHQSLKKELAALEKQWNDNQSQLIQLEKVHEKRVGDFIEISGLFKQFSNEFFVVVANSMVQFHLPQWQQRQSQMRQQEGLPALPTLEALWSLMLKYLVLQGQAIRFTADIVQTDGSLVTADALNIGPFTAVSDAGFLSYLPEVKKLVALHRQPVASLVERAENYFKAESGIVAAPIDPSRGALLSLLITSPTLAERIRQGGWIGYLILLIALVGGVVSLWRYFVLRHLRTAIERQRQNLERPDNNPLARLFTVYRENEQDDVESLELKLDEAIVKELPVLDYGLSLLKVFTVIAPLLGLLGTVVGMLDTFQAITLFGSGDPKLMAGGISQALVTTAMGLTVAIPLLLTYTYLSSQSRAIQDILQEQSVGLLASHGRTQ